jgi:hypothetical protein
MTPNEDWWKQGRGCSPPRRHIIRWDPRSTLRRRLEWAPRKFYIINYDPYIWVPEEELVWDEPEYDAKREGMVALFLLLGYFVAVLLVLRILFYYLAS